MGNYVGLSEHFGLGKIIEKVKCQLNCPALSETMPRKLGNVEMASGQTSQATPVFISHYLCQIFPCQDMNMDFVLGLPHTFR